MPIMDPSVVELSEKVDCRYTLVVETAKRARQLVAGSMPLIDTKDGDKPVSIAVKEIDRGLLGYERPEGEYEGSNDVLTDVIGG
jgi:DNA-directed RNA polymerase subunit omega